MSAVSPLGAPVPLDEAADGDEYSLRLPELDGQLMMTAGLCVGPRTHSLRMPRPEMPARFLRQPQSSEGALGFLPCLEAYGAWASASSSHMLAEYCRRTVADNLERGAVEQLCGASWALAEDEVDALPGDKWSAFISVCMENSLAYGEGLPELPPSVYPRLVARLQARLRAAVPNLWTVGMDEREPEEFATMLDTAVLDAWEELGKALAEEGHPEFVENDVDKFNAPETWMQAIHEARKRHELSSLVKLVLPKKRADALRAPDYASLAATDVVSLLEANHIDVQGRQRYLSRDDVALGFRMWADPRGFFNASGWKEVARKLLADRQTARAIRYAALRFRGSRALAVAFRGMDV